MSSADASASAEEDSTEDTVGEALGSLVAGGEGAPEVPVTSVVDHFPSVLGSDSSPDASEASQHGGQSPARDLEVPASSARRRAVEVFEDEGDSPDAVRLMTSASFPLLYSKGVVLLVVFSLFFLPFVVVLWFCLGFLP
jgi:hypothetical protein